MSKNLRTFAAGNGFSAQSMKRLTNILFLLVPLWCLFSYAQTPFDSFAPESSRPMLDVEFIRARDAYHAQQVSSQDTILFFVDITNGNIIASAPLTDELRKWISVDPLSDKYPNISPYAYCHWNPIGHIDPNGMDDLFDELGTYIDHIDNGTDYVLIQQANGNQQNLVDFSYSKNSIKNRAMLSNVASYYAKRVGLNQKIGVRDYKRKGAMAATDVYESCRVFMVIADGKISQNASTGNNIMNSFEHEKDHVEKGTFGPMAEIYAIVRQMNHSSWSETTTEYKNGIIGYLVGFANQALQEEIPYNSIEKILQPLGTSCPIWFNNNEFTILLPDLESISNK